MKICDIKTEITPRTNSTFIFCANTQPYDKKTKELILSNTQRSFVLLELILK